MSKKSTRIKPTAEERELAKIADERWVDYKKRFIPVENRGIGMATRELAQPSNVGPSLANLGAQQQFSGLEEQAARGLTLRGARPGSGSFANNITGLNIDRAASSGLNQAGALGLQRSQALQNLQTMVNVGQGKAGAALSGYSDLADAAARQSFLDAQASAASRAAIGQAIGTGTGMIYGNYRAPAYTTPPTDSGGTE